jgi:hypothetical protein
LRIEALSDFGKASAKTPVKVSMHFNFPFSEVAVIWTLTFAALLVLLVVLMGRDRVSRYPWFTASIVLLTLRMLASRLLFGKIAPLTSSEIFLTLADIGTVISLMVVVEMARRAFGQAARKYWTAWTLILLIVSGTVVALWGAWPPAASIFARSTLADLRLMQLVAQKADMLADLLIIELCVLIAFAGRRFGAGWRSHTQQIVLGLSISSLMQLGVRATWEIITANAVPKLQ